MKKCLIMVVLVVFLAGSLTLYSDSAKLPKAYHKMIKAYGGKKALSKINDQVIKGNINIKAYGVSGTLTLYSKEPNKLKVVSEVMGMTVIQAYDGETAWMDNPMAGGKKEMPKVFTDQFKREALGNAALLNPKTYGIQYKMAGSEKIKERKCIVLERIFPDGKKSVLYLDEKTYLPVMIKTTTLDQMGKTIGAESYVSEYKEVNGVMVAHRINNFRGGTEFADMTFTEVRHNTGLKDPLFQMNPK